MTVRKAIILLCQMYLPCFDDEEKEALTMAISALEKQVAKKPKTNADRIRAMSDEELALSLSLYTKCNICPFREDCDIGKYNDCEEPFLEWLKKEVEDE